MKKPAPLPTTPHQTSCRRLRAASTIAAAAFITASALAGCTSVRNNLGNTNSVCFRVLPEARAAVGTHAKFDGVRALPAKALLSATEHAAHRHVTVPARVEAAVKKPTCLVAFSGDFRLSGVKRAWAPHPGPYHVAIVVMVQSTVEVVATVLFKTMPLRFGHTFVFER